MPRETEPTAVRVPTRGGLLSGDLSVPRGANGLVLFVHGSGSSRLSPRNRRVARDLERAGLATLLFDLLTPEEEVVDERTRRLRFDIGLLLGRLLDATEWAASEPGTRDLVPGYFGASTGAGAALVAAARLGERVGAVVSRGGRPDLAATALERVVAPTLLLVGELDPFVVEVNREALARLSCERRMTVVPGATHLFEEPGALEEVARLAAEWFREHLAVPRTAGGRP
jgi:dienelactone hydrolase